MNVKKMTNAMLKEKVNAFQQVLYQCAKAKPKNYRLESCNASDEECRKAV